MSAVEKKKLIPEIDIALTATHDFVKFQVAQHMFDSTLLIYIFRFTASGASSSALVLSAFDKVMSITDAQDLITILNKIN